MMQNLDARSDPSDFIAQEVAVEHAAAEHRRREAARHGGVAWSGLAPEPYRASSEEALQARAQKLAAARESWRSSADGAFVTAIAGCQAAARAAHAVAERARSGAARGEPAPWRRAVLRELVSETRALAAAVRRVRRAISD